MRRRAAKQKLVCSPRPGAPNRPASIALIVRCAYWEACLRAGRADGRHGRMSRLVCVRAALLSPGLFGNGAACSEVRLYERDEHLLGGLQHCNFDVCRHLLGRALHHKARIG